MNIKFRVWDKNLKKFDDTNNYFIGPDGEVRYLTWNSEVNKGPWGWYVGYRDKRDDVIIQSWIGLKDKNNKEIFNGDIIKIKNNGIIFKNIEQNNVKYLVEWGNLGFTLTPINDDINPYCGYKTEDPIEYEIIGNIFENPELLEEK